MDDGSRNATADYIAGKLPDVPLARVKQHRDTSGLPDGVLGLEPWFGEVNILMLPDVIYEAAAGMVEQLAVLAGLEGFAMAATRLPAEKLKALGAVSVSEDNRVSAYEEKPSDPWLYNAAWGMIGFSGDTGLAGMRVVTDVTFRRGTCREPVTGAPVVWLAGQRDLGTWEAYSRELKKREA